MRALISSKVFHFDKKTKGICISCIFSNCNVFAHKYILKIYIYICIYRKSASQFSRGTVLNTLKQSRINIMRGKKDATTFPDKPVL